MNDFGMIVGQQLAAARRERGWTQARLAQIVGVARESIYRIERGRMPSGATAARLCDALGLDKAELSLDWHETDATLLYPSTTFLRDRRKARELSLWEVARAAGVSASTMSRFERGHGGSRMLVRRTLAGQPTELVNQGFAEILGFHSNHELTTFWQRGYL
ncbi:hypothetical protein SPMU_14770 [Sphingomonas mucosissima]|uniref:HTH cro/C1-type domain-containing protein n=2 Tax=Sphingomonas mucosissima TaxID=370959 RepID=A0A245ZL85_9SPHN|nr:hypothetical protein SPMU_14770 [Sphingomonas mucosissima]